MASMKEFSLMGAAALGLMALAIISVLGIAVLDGFKTATTGNNATIDLFITGITVFGTFASIIALVLVAKVIVGLIKGGF